MPTYMLSSGESFDTILLPKGTVLFRGFEMMHGNDVDTEVPFTELFGRQDDHGEYCVDAHHNTFFYPAPYMVDVVNRYSIHAIYITNYDLELVLMVRPSLRTRNVRGAIDHAPYSHCTDIGLINSCGKKRIHHDPCLSPLLIREYPNIHGYVAIASNDAGTHGQTLVLPMCDALPRDGAKHRFCPDLDAGHFKHGYFSTMCRENLYCAKSTAPFVVENARQIQSVPEIVLYPYHVRTSDDARLIHPRAVSDYPIQYALKHRAELNFFPLLYITEKKVYTWNDIESYAKRKEMGETELTNLEYISPILEKEKYIVQSALSPGGINIAGVEYRFTIDLRTGFYIASHKLVNRDLENTLTNNIRLYRSTYSDPYSPEKEFIIPFEYPHRLKRDIQGFLRRANKQPKHENDLVMALNRIGASFSKHYQFEISNPTKFKSYKLETMFPRPEFATKKRYTRKMKH